MRVLLLSQELDNSFVVFIKPVLASAFVETESLICFGVKSVAEGFPAVLNLVCDLNVL